jgi:hypothetical protein
MGEYIKLSRMQLYQYETDQVITNMLIQTGWPVYGHRGPSRNGTHGTLFLLAPNYSDMLPGSNDWAFYEVPRNGNDGRFWGVSNGDPITDENIGSSSSNKAICPDQLGSTTLSQIEPEGDWTASITLSRGGAH